MASDEKLHSLQQEEVENRIVQALRGLISREAAQRLSAISALHTDDLPDVVRSSATASSTTPALMAVSRKIPGLGTEGWANAGQLLSEEELRISNLDSRLLFISGPGTNNLVLSFFLSNPKKKYSREDVFAHLNRECEEQGIPEFWDLEKSEWGMGWDFSTSSKDVKNKAILKMGRGTILRVVENLRKLGLLEGLTNGKYRLDRGSQKVIALQHMIEEYPWNRDDDYRDFEIWTEQIYKKRKRYTHPDNFGELIRQYFSELEDLDKEKQKHFRSKISRLSHYCDIEEDESYSSVSRQIIGNNAKNNWIIKILNEKDWNKERLKRICKNIGHKDNSALSRKTKAKLIDYIVKNSP